jgi:hypothetical protein
MAAHKLAQHLASMGRNGDSMLMHVQPEEVAGLQALARSKGTTLTINPDTGLPEAFSMGNFFRQLAPTIAGAGVAMIPGMQPFGLSAMQAGIAAGAATGAALNKEDPLMGAVMGGMGGYGGANLAGSALGSGTQGAFEHSMGLNNAYSAGAGQTAASVAPTATTANTSNVITNGGIGPNMGQVNATNNLANFQSDMGLNKAFQAGDPKFANLAPVNDASTLGNLNQAYENIAEDPTAYLKQNAMGIGLPVGMAALSASQPENTPFVEEKYDPYARLNLGGGSSKGESGLRLLAGGGPVSFAEGGSPALQGPNDMDTAQQADAISGSGAWGFTGPWGSYNTWGARDYNATESKNPIQAMLAARRQELIPAQSTEPRNPMQAFLAERRQELVPPQSSEPKNKMQAYLASLRNQQTTSMAEGGLTSLFENQDGNIEQNTPMRPYGMGRLQQMADGGMAGYAKGGYLDGPGDGMSDSIPATIEGKQPARLADGEFVIPADVVSHLGNGSTKAGSQRLYSMLDKVRKARTGTKKQGKQINPNKYMPA